MREYEVKLSESARAELVARAAAGEWEARQVATLQHLAAREQEVEEHRARIKVLLGCTHL